jgi:thymidylate synthase (FAD)
LKLHVKLPVFVARQWIRHRTANVNEYSARYSILDREFYIPAPDQLAAQSTVNNQGRGEVLTGEEAARVLDLLKSDANRAYDHYEAMLSQDGQQGLARELARMNLPANIYTQWYWKVDLHNLFHFLRLRADPHAQYEIRVSSKAISVLKRRLAGETVTQEASGMSKGEWREFVEIWG